MVSLTRRFPRTTVLIVNLALLGSLLLVMELLLRRYFPIHLATIGHRASENAARYGWGFSPGESIKILDPDTGATYRSHANSHGWRDKDRNYENTRGAYRILVLGDSSTFGAIVPAESIYTRQLEEKLNKNGYNAEVISIAYGGWGTDQELEALMAEGLAYKPNLVLVQFCTNDITDNSYFYHAAMARDQNARALSGLKPFYYDLDEHRSVRRNQNPNFSVSSQRRNNSRLADMALRSQIIRRLYAGYLHIKSRREAVQSAKYRATNNQILQLEAVVGLTKQSRLYTFLDERRGITIPEKILEGAIDASGLHDKTAIIKRILEDRWFTQHWSVENFRPSPIDADSYDWKLYFALISEIKNRSNSIGADVAIFPETEEGQYDWDRSWYRVSDDQASKVNSLSHIAVLKSAMSKLGIDVIGNTKPYQRARNDPHPNAQGNQAMADDIFEYLLTRNDFLKRHDVHQADRK